MTDRLYATFDPAAIGPSLALEQSNTIVVTTATADINRTVRALYGKASRQWFGEFAAYGDAPIAGAVSFGVVDASASLTTYVGGDSHGYGYRVGDGAIYHAGSSIASVATGDKGDIIGIWIQIGDGSAPTVTWLLNGTAVHTQALPNPGPWYLAVTISSQTADSLRAWVNTGQRQFEFPVPGVDGWYEYPTDAPTLRVSTIDYISHSDDAFPNEVWEGRIGDEGIEIVRQLQFWPDGGSGTQDAALNVQLLNADHALDWLLDNDMRGRSALLQWIDERASTDEADDVAEMVVGDVQASDDGRMTVSLSGAMSTLDMPLQTRIFPPSSDPVVAGKPWPIALGAVRSATPVLVDPINRVYVLSDRGLPGWGYVRDMGAPLDPNAIPPGYVIDAQQRGITLETNPVGKLTADVSSTGGGTLPSLADDVWSGYGSPFMGSSGSAPTGWDVAVSSTISTVERLRMESTGLAASAVLGMAAVTCIEGRSYRYRVTVVSIPGAHSYGRPSVSIRAGTTTPLAVFTAPGTYEGVITATANFSPRIVFSDALTGSAAIIRDVFLLELPDVYSPSELNPITLTDFVAEIIEGRAGLPASVWSRADTEAIDAATGSRGIGFFADSATTVRAALAMAMSAYCACAWIDDANVLRFTRLVIPEDEVAVGEITDDDMLTELQVRTDLAPQLSTQINFRRDWTVLSETDFVSDFITVPMAVRRALGQQYQGIAASAIPLSGTYSAAVSAAPQPTLIDDPADAQTAIDHVARYYSKLRRYYTTEVSAEHGLKLGQVWTIRHPNYGLAAGRNVQVSRISRRLLNGTVSVTFRG